MCGHHLHACKLYVSWWGTAPSDRVENDSKIRAVKDWTSDLWANKKVQILYSNRTPMDVVRAKVCIWACLCNCGNMTMRVCIYEKSDVSDSSLIVNLPYHCLSRSDSWKRYMLPSDLHIKIPIFCRGDVKTLTWTVCICACGMGGGRVEVCIHHTK